MAKLVSALFLIVFIDVAAATVTTCWGADTTLTKAKDLVAKGTLTGGTGPNQILTCKADRKLRLRRANTGDDGCEWKYEAAGNDWVAVGCTADTGAVCDAENDQSAKPWKFICNTEANCLPTNCPPKGSSPGGSGGTNEPTGKAAARFASSSLIIILTTIVLLLIGRIP